MKKFLHYFIISLTLFSTLSCDRDDDLSGKVSATVSASNLVIENGSDEPIYLFYADQNTLAAIDWAPSVEGPALNPGQTDRIPLTEVLGYSSESEVIIVHYWNAIVVGNERFAGAISTTRIDL